MTGKRFSHNGVVIIDHLKKDLIYIEGKEDLLELAEYVDRLQEENIVLKKKLEFLNELNKPYGELIGENQRLKKELDRFHEEKIRLIRENTRLKKKLKEHNDMLEWHQGGW